MIREITVHFTIQWCDFTAQFLNQHGAQLSGNAVTGIHHHFQRRRHSNITDDTVQIGAAHVVPGLLTLPSGKVSGLDALVQLLDSFTRQGLSAQHDLQAVIVGWIMATGHHNARTGLQVMGCKVQHRRRYGPQVNDVTTSRHDAAPQGISQFRTGVPAIVANTDICDTTLGRFRADRATNDFNHLCRKGLTNDAPDVIGAEDFRVDLNRRHLGLSHFRNVLVEQGILGATKAEHILVSIEHVNVRHVLVLKEWFILRRRCLAAGRSRFGRSRLRGLGHPLLNHLGQTEQHFSGGRHHIPAQSRQFHPLASEHLVGPLNERGHILTYSTLSVAKKHPDQNRRHQRRHPHQNRQENGAYRRHRCRGRLVTDGPVRVDQGARQLRAAAVTGAGHRS